MSLGKQLCLSIVLLVVSLFTGCSSGSSGGMNSIQSAVQDLAQDPDGLVTVITLRSTSGLAGASSANFTASGGQTALDVQVAGALATVTWDARVSPADTVAVAGVAGISAAAHAVSSSDSSAPTYTVTSADMNAGLGADVIVLQFAGTHVVGASAEDVTHWALSAGSYTIDLSDSSFVFDAGAQTLTMNLGLSANVWPDFTLVASGVKSVAEVDVDGAGVDGTGTGDATAPSLVSAEQNFALDPLGRTLEFTFDEAMSPVMFTSLGRYAGAGSDLAIAAEALSPLSVRVVFNNPIVPGLDTIDLNGLFDAHGNAFPDTNQAIAQSNPLPNAVATPSQAVTLPNSGNDYITFTTTIAFDPDSALDWHNWTLDVAGNPVDLSTQTFAYDLVNHVTTITLDFDLQNGQNFTLSATDVVDVDGVYSALTDSQSVAGDAAAPVVTSIVQNRSVDTTGATVDVSFDEEVEEVQAETTANWLALGGQSILSATRQASPNIVRLVFDAPLIPTVDSLSCLSIADLAGNPTMFTQLVTASTDTSAPSVSSASANALAGEQNDTLVVTFDDRMYEAEVTDSTRWTVESPSGSALDLVPSSVAYDASLHRATLTLQAATANLQNGSDFSVAFTGLHDVGHNALAATATTGQVTSETISPTIAAAYLDSSSADQVVLTFSEPCARLDDLYDASLNPDGTRFVLRDSGGALRGQALMSSVLSSGLSVRLFFGLTINPSDTLDVVGVTDLAGNPLYPVLAQPLQVEDTTAPTLLSATATTLSGESNDTLVLVFDRPMSSWGITSYAHYSLSTAGSGAIGLQRAAFAFDGAATVTITLAGSGASNLSTGDALTISASGLYSAQGVAVAGSSSVGPQAVTGDLAAPSVGVNNVRLDPSVADSLLIEFSEALSPAAAATLANYDLDGGNLATAATLVGPRVVRATFAVTPAPGDSLDVSGTDMAGNTSGVFTRTVQSADSTGPLVSSVAGVATSGYGGDRLVITYSEPVKTLTAFSQANYVVTSNGAPISLVGSLPTYDSATNTVTFRLASGQELDSAVSVHVSISNVQDVAGNAMPATVATTGAVSGDSSVPTIASSFVDWAVDASGATVDVGFSEDVVAASASTLSNWSTNGSANVSAVLRLSDKHYRVSLSAPLGAGELVSVAAIRDPAGNAAGGALSSNPLE